MYFLIQQMFKNLKIMINLIIGIALTVIIGALIGICVLQKAEILDMERTLDRISEFYRQESERKAEKLAEDVFRDDMEILNRLV